MVKKDNEETSGNLEKENFGFEKVSREEKSRKVQDVFSSVAMKYDVMNDFMSLGLHRLWKRFAIRLCQLEPNNYVLDLAGGTGDLTKLIAKKIGSKNVIIADANNNMLTQGIGRLFDYGFNVKGVQCDGGEIPFAANTFDCVTVGFGIRNMTKKEQVLTEINRVLKWGGRAVILEFSEVWKPVKKLYDNYSFKVLPFLGDKIAKDSSSYQYLAESIEMHPSQEEFKKIMERAGFSLVEYYNLTMGVVAIHKGVKS